MRGERFQVAVVGAGAVGATSAYAMLVRGAARRVVLHDINAAKVRAEVLDLGHGAMFVPEAEIDGSDDVEICGGSDVVVVTAGAKQKPGQTRMDLAGATVDLMKKVLPAVQAVAPDAIYVLVTNPVDVVTYASLKITDLPPDRIFGSGTVLDSSRLRWLVSEACEVAVGNVHAYMAGEHGDTEVPLWSSAAIGGVPLTSWEQQTGRLGPARRDEIAHQVVNAAYEVIAGKGATNYAVGLAVARIVESIRRDDAAGLARHHRRLHVGAHPGQCAWRRAAARGASRRRRARAPHRQCRRDPGLGPQPRLLTSSRGVQRTTPRSTTAAARPRPARACPSGRGSTARCSVGWWSPCPPSRRSCDSARCACRRGRGP